MKRLVICCDGTWNRADNTTVSNVEKIARTIQLEPEQAAGVQQMVLYLPGVGTAGYQTDKILGGAFGLGLTNNVLNAYRFLSINYQPGDEIFIIGFSRGAYTARSLAGMVGKVGLLTREAMIGGHLPEAGQRYRHRGEWPQEWSSPEQFRAEHCHPSVPITFLGVFDTVGALGVPGVLGKRHQFHDVELGDAVRVARQALAVDEPRMKFEPCLWLAPPPDKPQQPGRIKQVWFEGAHSDVGGGYEEAGLSDTALLWMAAEAQAQGLVFDCALFREQLGPGTPVLRHDPSSALYKTIDTVARLKIVLGRAKGESFDGRRRRLHRPDSSGVAVASTTVARYLADGDYRPTNLTRYAEATQEFIDVTETTLVNPSEAYDALLERFVRECAAPSPG